MAKVFAGHDWAETHHDVHAMNAAGDHLAHARLSAGVEGVADFHDLVAALTDDATEVIIATETDRGLFVGALVASGYGVIAVNPRATSRYRERYSVSGAKSDPGDAFVLADLARTAAHKHRRVAGDSELAEAIKTVARAHQSLIWARRRHTNQVRALFVEFYP